MSIRPSVRWSGSPSTASRAIRIMPAQVPNTGAPPAWRSRIGCSSPYAIISFDIVVDSPPGMTRPRTPSRSLGWRTSTGSSPTSRSAWACSRNAPWSASTPTREPLPATRLQQAILAERRHLDADHRLTEAGRHLGQDDRVVVVRDRLDDRGRALGRVTALEDAGADEDAVGAHLHHHRGVGRRRQPAGGEGHHREPTVLGAIPNQVIRRAVLLGGREQLALVHGLQPADLAEDRAHVAHGLDAVARSRLALGADP